jgi:hypothetical protein
MLLLNPDHIIRGIRHSGAPQRRFIKSYVIYVVYRAPSNTFRIRNPCSLLSADFVFAGLGKGWG